jgi:hypothetical protein
MRRPQQKNHVRLEMQFELGSLDRFLSALDNPVSAQSGDAVPQGIGEYTRNIGEKS